MSRYSNVLRSAPHEARRLLRGELASGLPTSEQLHLRRQGEADDRSVLQILSTLQIVDPYEKMSFTARYDQSRAGVEGAPTLQELVDQGWVQIGLGTVHLSLDLRIALEDPPAEISWALPLRDALPKTSATVNFSTRTTLPKALTAATKIDGPLNGVRVFARTTRDPRWVAARLWEHARAHFPEHARLAWWIARWRLLDFPFFAPARVWAEGPQEEFLDKCASLFADPDLPAWDKARERAAVQIVLASKRFDVEAARDHVPEPTADWIGRHTWLDSNRIRFDPFDAHGDYGALLHLCLEDAIDADRSRAPHSTVERLLPLIDRSPHLFWRLKHCVLQAPVLLADFVMMPATAGWAAHVVAQWNGGHSGGWEVGLERLHTEGRRRAFDTMVDVLADHATGRHRDEAVPGVIGLLRWLESRRRERDVYGRRRLDPELAEVGWRSLPVNDAPLAQAVLTRLAALVAVDDSPVGGASFAVAVRLLDRAAVELKEPGVLHAVGVLVEGYRRSIAAPRYGAEHAAVGTPLMRLGAQDETLAKALLTPYDFAAAAKDALCLETSARRDRVCALERGLRTHLRFLASSLGDTSHEPTELVEATAHHLRLGAGSNLERGRVDAIRVPDSVRWTGVPDSLPSTVGRALRRLDEPGRERIVGALITTEDPTFLARVMSAGPPGVQEVLSNRLAELGPAHAAEVFDLNSLQQRRHALLAAGEVKLAMAFLEQEKNVSTLGPVRGRRADEFAFELRVAFAEGRYDEIATRSLPDPDWPSESERTEAARTLDFYRAISEMSREGGNLDVAERTLHVLTKSDPTAAAIAINLHAVRIRRARDAKAPTRLAPKLRAEGAQLLERRELTECDRHTVEANLAVLDTYTGNYREALERLRRLPENTRFAPVPTATAVHALVEFGDVAAAHAWLETAAEWMGWTEALETIRDELEAKRPRASSGVTVLVGDTAGRRRELIGAYLNALQQLPPEDQAHIASGGRDLGAYLLDLLGQAASALQDHAPSLVPGKTVPYFEDNLTRLIASIIQPRVGILDWVLYTHPHRGGTACHPTIPDLIFKQGEAIIAIVEAVWGPHPNLTKTVKEDLRKHLKKIFGYGPAQHFFHLIYTQGGDLDELLAEAARLAREEAPLGFECRGEPETIRDFGKPPRVISTHENPRSATEPLSLIQLVIDLGREAENSASRSAKSKSS